MKKYDKVFNSEKRSKESLSPEEAVAAIAVITALVDSTVEDVDAESLTDILWEFEVFDEYSEDDMVEIVYRLIAIAEAEGLGPLFNTASASLSDELVLDAFAAGVIMVLNDEDLTIPTQKQPYIKKLQAALELEEEEAEEIIKEVIAALEEDDDEEYPEDEYQTVLLEDIDQQVYQSPMGNFIVPIPVTSEQGGKIQSQSGVVRFSDDFDSLLRIDYYPFSPEQIEEIESQGKENYLKSILEDKYVPQAIFANLPEASIKSSEYLKDIWHGSYYVLVDMPQGSTISKLDNNGSSARLDAYRGLLALINQDFLYVVSSQRSFLKGDSPGSIAEESENIKESILKFVDTIEFT
ncbi:tellurite resistance TerB family protein [Cronbergia sp. UHCC 0137]|uniref:tellurite resistance TerB family protein n=1 Tax=Cronbergia sp. UHCC 0137 TaxID=3110239 RepID=UPI002B20F5E4|nr:tellurite resistance TerB family protein [Cronbergia sp. UHCC 0137]MEA5618101.1 tellurite resistance TerB family protein [Cronbergia sp. UHCC 0137]